jgi:2-dehydropantoate 2-reductase
VGRIARAPRLYYGGQMSTVRYVIYGAGAVGGAIGGRLAQAGHSVSLIARGAHAAALKERGLELRAPDEKVETLRLPVVEHPAALALREDDVVILAVKSQDTRAALLELEAVAPPRLSVVCAQNGVVNEQTLLRHFENVISMCVVLPAAHLTPGVVEIASAGLTGILDVGRYPAGVDERSRSLARALCSARFLSQALPDVRRWKYRKLLMNLLNAVQATTGVGEGDVDAEELVRLARAEGTAVLRAAGIDFASESEDRERRGQHLQVRSRSGGSTWQSLTRGTGAVEADYLNGEIVLLGRLHGVPTPTNAVLQRTANDFARRRLRPGSISPAELLSQVRAAARG